MSNNFDPKITSSAALAYLGDSVIEVCVRKALVESGLSSSAKLNAAALDFVRASAQATASAVLIDILSTEEAAVFRRGRNIGHSNVPKSATVSEYRRATGLEALFGYLYLMDRQERICQLFELAYKDKLLVLRDGMQKDCK